MGGRAIPLFKAEKTQVTKNVGIWDVELAEDDCKACGFCSNICPVDVFASREVPNRLGWFSVYVKHEQNCFGCMLCFQICPDFCIDVTAKTRPAAKPGKEKIS
ncbi:MAG: 4Fe-4S dicluster domain-containing protein [Alphaproteobacteria bacterium]|jgi:NAD-dependent dihydropyrimidine dehydrogenase PreA subunit|nr:4Fe-4S ferredoxin [Rhodospirillaceae bacterium]MDP6021564.1 4Fe-4S dicluster domain-containing protein [Alphaproteobacteria bacterium]MDP6256486.1 4Fe-4S dicluster domain-containing protein [Alphaproteobacteria bacterium]MDP7056333.1 4Fe-4S dicluster domain-containing protein [Alphaproteobacteria bacterium]MDP7228369.1 4Fe-4S dicluster domain-containing protein [Alphaproteobacteria bacterium]|tara:strand:+ start:3834 stop:4142 length:309 start_codon:yes stop_codon:yes gene_type:complete